VGLLQLHVLNLHLLEEARERSIRAAISNFHDVLCNVGDSLSAIVVPLSAYLVVLETVEHLLMGAYQVELHLQVIRSLENNHLLFNIYFG